MNGVEIIFRNGTYNIIAINALASAYISTVVAPNYGELNPQAHGKFMLRTKKNHLQNERIEQMCHHIVIGDIREQCCLCALNSY